MSADHLIIFDVDGTLVDSQRSIVDAMCIAFKENGFDAPCEKAVRRIVGLSLVNAIGQLLPNESHDAVSSVAQSYKDQFVSARVKGMQLCPFPGMVDLVRTLQDAGYYLGVATGNSKRGLKHTLETLGLDGAFFTQQTADEHPSKPHPSMLHQAMGDVGADPAQTIMIGDTSFDIEMAGNANVHGLGVSWGYHEEDDLTNAGAHHVAKDANDLAAYLRRWSIL